ncbi:hypothetical protein BHE74_00014225 [Ensete ventricosum]|nr:hypothetical protein GW17_00060186 [Ensete ventricosum]RWW77609.1 hypothetical protein BHE74_00014225 [Ensete ventricosum]RZR79694.1 hypothetical protein BHM03_00005490 [Ensete ventricosum]
MVNQERWGKLDPCSKQPQVGYKCKLTRKLLESLIRSATVNKTSMKLGILREWRRRHLERLTMAENHHDVLKAGLEELYQGQRRLLRVESLHEEAESRIEKVESLINRLIEDTKIPYDIYTKFWRNSR